MVRHGCSRPGAIVNWPRRPGIGRKFFPAAQPFALLGSDIVQPAGERPGWVGVPPGLVTGPFGSAAAQAG